MRVLFTVFAAALAIGAAGASVPTDAKSAGAFDLLPGNLLVNGDFESGAESFRPVLRPGAATEIQTPGFESGANLSITVPAKLHTTENFLAQTVAVDPAEPCRSYRITYWLRYKVLSDRNGGAGVMVTYLDAGGNPLGRTGTGHLRKVEDKKNQWQAIDQLKDGWWDSYELSFTLPPEARSMRIECGLFQAAGTADFDRIILEARPAVSAMLSESSPISVKVLPEVVKPYLAEQLFGVNAEFRYPGIYRGTLPESDPANRRREFAAALHQAGVKVLRFPGGMPAHEYFTEGPEAQAKLFAKFPKLSWYFRGFDYPRLENVLDFCRQYGFQMNFQINTQFFPDSDGEVYPITDNKHKKENPSLYGKDRLPTAKAAFERFVKSLPPKAIKYWEFGNEEFALMSVKDYAAIVAAFLPVIKAYNPDAEITVTGNTWPDRLCELLKESGTLDRVDYFSAHYPWGDHWRPEPGGEKDLERFVCGKLNWAVNTNAHLKLLRAAGFPNIKMAGNETSVFKFHTWDAHRVIYTPAHGLLLAANWMEAMKIPDMDTLTFHDLESPFFGMILYEQYYDPAKERFTMIKKGENPPTEAAADYLLRDRYLVLPSGLAMKQLARHCGMNVLKTEMVEPVPSQRPLFDLLVSRDGERLLATLVNRGAVSRKATLDVSAFAKAGTAKVGGIRWNSLDELPRPPIELSGNVPVADGRLAIEIAPYSITQLEIMP